MVVVMTSVTIKNWLSWLVGNYHQELVDNVDIKTGLGNLIKFNVICTPIDFCISE